MTFSSPSTSVSPHAGAHAAVALRERGAHLSEHRRELTLDVPRLDAESADAVCREIRISPAGRTPHARDEPHRRPARRAVSGQLPS